MYEREFIPVYEPEYREKDYSKIPFLKRGQGFNTHISSEKLMLIPKNLRS